MINVNRYAHHRLATDRTRIPNFKSYLEMEAWRC